MIHPILQQYIKLTEFLGQALGPDYEVALHDLTDKNRSIIAIANGHISGRKAGAPLTNMALQILKDKSYKNVDYRLHYSGVSADGKTLRSSTFYIKDGEQLIGMLCINFDDRRYQLLGEELLRICHPDTYVDTMYQWLRQDYIPVSQDGSESFHNTIEAVAADAVNQELAKLGVTAERLTAEERIEIIERLEASGIFLLKGAVQDVADALSCSLASVYRYLSQIRRDG